MEIDKDHLDRGITIAEHYAEEALRLTSAAGVNADLTNAKKLLDSILTKWGEDFIAIKPLVEIGPNALRDTRTMKRLIAILVEHHWLEPAPVKTVVANKPRREAWKIVREGKAEG